MCVCAGVGGLCFVLLCRLNFVLVYKPGLLSARTPPYTCEILHGKSGLQYYSINVDMAERTR